MRPKLFFQALLGVVSVGAIIMIMIAYFFGDKTTDGKKTAASTTTDAIVESAHASSPVEMRSSGDDTQYSNPIAQTVSYTSSPSAIGESVPVTTPQRINSVSSGTLPTVSPSSASETGTPETDLDQILSDLSGILIQNSDDGVIFELSYNYTRKNVIVFMIPTGNETSLFFLDNLLGGEESMQIWKQIVSEINEISYSIHKGLLEKGHSDITSYVQLWDRATNGRNLLTSKNGEVIYDFFEETGWVFGRNESNATPHTSSTDTSQAQNATTTEASLGTSDAQNNASTQETPTVGNTVTVQAVTAQNPYNYDFPSNVWLSATDGYFHEKNACGHMNPNYATPVTLKYALTHNIAPCTDCFPGAEK
ncbi:MAG: hypothetical protein IK016_11180 [Lachnospiraceae bacterium]|nr:hypothetical protein [Lachnospiraceae bacterium]